MKGNLGSYLTILGFLALAFYGVMYGCGYLRADALPQFAISAVIFLTAGRMLRRVQIGETEEKEAVAGREPDWAWLTALLNWTAVVVLIALMGILLLKPAGLSMTEALKMTTAHKSFFAGAIP